MNNRVDFYIVSLVYTLKTKTVVLNHNIMKIFIFLRYNPSGRWGRRFKSSRPDQ